MMEDTDEAAQISKQSANVWWSANLGRPVPTFVPPEAFFQARELVPPVQVALPLVLSLLGLLFGPFAWAAWAIAAREVRRIDDHRRDTLVVADLPGESAVRGVRGLAIAITVIPLMLGLMVIVVAGVST